MACQIIGTGFVPIELYRLVTTNFIEFEVLDFQLKATGLHELVNSNPKYLSAEEIIWILKTKLQSLKAQRLWSPAESKKEDTEGDLDGLNLTMDKLVESQKRGQTGGNGRYQDGKAWDLSGITCFQNHNKGHLQDNFPLAKKAGESSRNEENLSASGSYSTTAWRHKRPESGYLETRAVNGTT